MNIKSTFGGALACALFLAGTVAAQASSVWSTGQVTNGSGQDQNYSVLGYVTNSSGNSNAAYFSSPPSITESASGPAVVYFNSAYTGLTFISSNPDGGRSESTTVYQVQFVLDAASTISGLWAADNGAVIYNNGAFVTGLATANNDPASNYASTTPFSFLASAGVNTLNFFVTDGGGPTAFAFNVQSVVASAVPGPVLGAGLPGLVMAIGGFVAWRRRRMAAA